MGHSFGHLLVCSSLQSQRQLGEGRNAFFVRREVPADEAGALLLGADVLFGESFGSVESLPIGVLKTFTSFSVISAFVASTGVRKRRNGVEQIAFQNDI